MASNSSIPNTQGKKHLISINSLTIHSNNKTVLDISFEFENSLAIIGESGSGKSLTLKAILGLLPQSLKSNISIKAPFELKNGDTVSFVPQNAFTALSKLSKIKKQFWSIQGDFVLELLKSVGLDESVLERFPSELSGGQIQRIVLAIALSSKPKLLLLDEPTTALDEENKTIVLELIKNLSLKYGFKIIFVTHEIMLSEGFCEDMLVIKNGKIVEYGKSHDIITTPKNEYTKSLLEANFKNRKFRQ